MGGRQDVQHAVAHRDLDQRLTAAGQSLMIATEPTPSDDPREGALDHPSSGLRTKAFGEKLVPINLFVLEDKQPPFGNRERLDRLDGPPQGDLGPDAEGAAIVAVSPHQLHARKEALQWLQQGSTSFLIGALGPKNLDRQQVALRLNEHVAFPAPDFFSPRRSPFRGRAPHWF